MLADDAAEPATMLVRHRRDVYGNGEDWDPAVNLGMACFARVYVQCIKIDAHNTK